MLANVHCTPSEQMPGLRKLQTRYLVQRTSIRTCAGSHAEAVSKYDWKLDDTTRSKQSERRKIVREIPINDIRRPLGSSAVRANDPEKVQALMVSIKEVGLFEPIDVLEVDGVYYGFSGCHRFEAHKRLGQATIMCNVRKATPEVLKMHG